MEKFNDKVVLVTGAGQGLGAVVAEMLVKEGAKVVGTDINQKNVESVADTLQAEGEIIGLAQDVSKKEDWQKVLDQTIETYGQLDILINNASITSGNNISSLTVFKDKTLPKG